LRRTLATLPTATGLAVSSLRAHKLRTFLTLLGIIIGVCSVIVVGATLEGFTNYSIQTTSKVFGSESFQIGQLIDLGRLSRRERVEKLKYNRRIRQEDYVYLKQTAGDAIYYSPYRQRAEDTKYGNITLESTVIIGAAANLPEIRDVSLTEGRFFTEEEERRGVMVAIAGDDLKETLFAGLSPLGRVIKIAGFDFTIIGVQEKVGNVGGQSQDNVAYIPISAFNRLFGPANTLSVFGKARRESGLSLEEALDLSRVALRTRFKARPGKPDNFDTATPDSAIEFIKRILTLVGSLLVPVTCISLVVGGIVVMNIMLVSVTERTREIGVRKSLGARRSDLMLQFLMESALMSALGGAIGLLLAYAITSVATAVSGVPILVDWRYVLLALFVSTSVGVASGWYPASRAAKMDPVEALRAD
jgi:putative ABC transport system permease protein